MAEYNQPKDYVTEGDTCPECGEETIKEDWSRGTFYLKCNNCGAMWNDRGMRVPIGDM